MAGNGSVLPNGAFFIAGRVGKRKDGSGDWGLVELIQVKDGDGSVAQCWCDADVARRAKMNFTLMDAVEPVFMTRLSGGRPRTDLTELLPA
jgi:hypothetical protein